MEFIFQIINDFYSFYNILIKFHKKIRKKFKNRKKSKKVKAKRKIVYSYCTSDSI